MATVKSFAGAAAATTLSAGIASGTTSFAVADGSTYPSANFNIVIDKGLAGEEKCLVTSRSGNTFTIGTRGYDGTTAAAHSSGASVQHCGTAVDFQENNDHIVASTNVHGLSGGAAVVGTTTSQTLSNKTLTTPTVGDFTNANHTHTSTAQGGAINAAVASGVAALSMTSYVPVVGGTGWAVGNGTISGAYLQIGKMVHVWIYWDLGSTSTFHLTNEGTISLPVAADTTIQLTGSMLGLVGSYVDGGGSTTVLTGTLASSTTMALEYIDAGTQAVRSQRLSSSLVTASSAGYMLYSGIYVAA